MSELTTMLSDIEEAIQQRLESKGLAVSVFDINDSPQTIRTPGANIAFYDGSCRRISDSTYSMDAKIYVTVVQKNERSEKARRLATYPLVMGVVSIISGQKLSIVEAGETRELAAKRMQPGRIRKVLDTSTRIAFTIEFSTRFNFEIMSDEEASDMTALALQYFFKPGDDVQDAEDILSYEE